MSPQTPIPHSQMHLKASHPTTPGSPSGSLGSRGMSLGKGARASLQRGNGPCVVLRWCPCETGPGSPLWGLYGVVGRDRGGGRSGRSSTSLHFGRGRQRKGEQVFVVEMSSLAVSVWV